MNHPMFNKSAKNIFKLLVPFLVVTIFAVPLIVGAQSGEGLKTNQQLIEIKNPFKESSIEGLIRTLINDILIPIGAVVAVLMVMYAGFLYVTARGNPAQIGRAHQALLWAVIGAAILLGAWVISEAISGTINELKK